MAWDWQVFCKETTSGDVIPGCFGRGGDVTYVNWILSAWGWTMSVSRRLRFSSEAPGRFRTGTRQAHRFAVRPDVGKSCAGCAQGR